MHITVRTEAGFVPVPWSIVFNDQIKANALKLWCVLYAIGFRRERCTMKRLKSEMGTQHDRTIRLWLRELEEHNLITGWKRYGDLDEIIVHSTSNEDVRTLQSIRDALEKPNITLEDIKRIVGSEIRNTGSETRNVGSEIRNTGSETRNVGSVIRNTGSARNTGSESRNTDSAFRNTGSESRNVGSVIRNTGSETRNVGSEIDSTDSFPMPQNGVPKSLKNQDHENHESPECSHSENITAAAAWEQTTITLQQVMPRGDFAMIQSSELVQLVDGLAVIACPDLRSKQLLEELYSSVTRSALRSAVPGVDVRFVIKKGD